MIGILNLGITLDLSGSRKIIEIGCNVYAAANTTTVTFSSSTSQSRSQTVTIDNLYSISSMTVNTGSVSYSVNGNNVTINVSGGSASRTGTLSDTAQWITLTGKKITVTGLNPNTGYTFYAKTRNAENAENTTVSSASNTTLVAPPGMPSNLRVISNTADTITIAWDSVPGATGYDVEKDGIWVDNGSVTTTS